MQTTGRTHRLSQGRCAKGFKTMCGGQALIEGIMMRGPKKQAVVVRKPDGELEIQEKELKFIKDRYPVLGLPLIRGVVNFCDSMYNGVKALMYSAEFFPEDEEAEPEEPSKFELWLEKQAGQREGGLFVHHPGGDAWAWACPSACFSCCPPCWARRSPW